MTRAGLESEAVKRLLHGIHDDAMREILARCLDGSISPSVALMQMLIETEDAAVVRAAVDDVTRRAAAVSRSGDSLLRDRVDDLTQLVVENEQGCSRIAEMLRSNMDSPESGAKRRGRNRFLRAALRLVSAAVGGSECGALLARESGAARKSDEGSRNSAGALGSDISIAPCSTLDAG